MFGRYKSEIHKSLNRHLLSIYLLAMDTVLGTEDEQLTKMKVSAFMELILLYTRLYFFGGGGYILLNFIFSWKFPGSPLRSGKEFAC